ncbi:MAG: hypothetical protein E7Y34_02200 [Mycoplasma sp.]|nr:hypothetical protein [Mycoplasma sp.]
MSSSPYTGERIIVMDGLGVLYASKRENIVPAPTKAGSVISDGNKLIVAQEIAATMDNDFTTGTAGGKTAVIKTINNKMIDNENALKNGVFSVSEIGTYQIIINAQLTHDKNFRPVIGLWDESIGKWIARTNDFFTAPKSNKGYQTYTLITTVELSPRKNYSFRAYGSSGNVTIKSHVKDDNGDNAVSYFFVKRIK